MGVVGKEKTRLIVIASACLLISREAGSRQQYEGPSLTDVAVERVAESLTLSEAQSLQWNQWVKDYRQTFAEFEMKVRATQNDWDREFWFALMPELDENVDISHLSPGMKQSIINRRKQWDEGHVPLDLLTPADRDLRNARLIEFGKSFYIMERKNREQTLNRLRGILDDSQLDRWPMTMRRLEINLEDQNPAGRYGWDDPRWKVDMLRLLREATEEDGELHAIADAINVPEVVLLSTKSDEPMKDLAGVIQGFEIEYASALDDFSWKKLQLRYEALPLHNAGDLEAAEELRRQERDLERAVWVVRVRFMENVADLVGEMLGDDAREAWLRRCRVQFCPVLYYEESTDILYRNIMALEGIDEAILAAIRELYDRHCAWREAYKPRMVKLEIEEDYTTNWYEEGDERNLRRRLKDAYDERHRRALLIKNAFRTLLPPEHKAALDQWWEDYKKKTVVMGMEINVRP